MNTNGGGLLNWSMSAGETGPGGGPGVARGVLKKVLLVEDDCGGGTGRFKEVSSPRVSILSISKCE